MTVRRLYDDRRRKRQVFVYISTWRGRSIGAKHYYAKVYEDDNPIVRGSTHVYLPDDKDCKGRTFGGLGEIEFVTFDAAFDWVVQIIIDEFPRETHKLWDTSGGLITLRQLKTRMNTEPWL